jgi:hypothetical protein
MAQRTVWLRRDPVGSHTQLPARAEFRRYHARRAFFLGTCSLVSLAILVVLEGLDAVDGAWRPLVALSFFLGIAGIGAAAISLRMRELRTRALAALGLSAAASVLALLVPTILD